MHGVFDQLLVTTRSKAHSHGAPTVPKVEATDYED
jgi:hypothetical protein